MVRQSPIAQRWDTRHFPRNKSKDVMQEIIQELIGSYIDNFCIYPASIRIEFHKRQSEGLIRYSLATDGNVSKLDEHLVSEDDYDVLTIYRCIGKTIKDVTRGEMSVTLYFEDDVSIFVDCRESLGDYSISIERNLPNESVAETFLLD